MLSAVLYQQITRQKVLPVLVLDNNEQARILADSLLEFRLNAIEITLRTPKALNVIEFLATRYPELVVGAGTITSTEQLQDVQQSGAQFALSPGAPESLLQAGQRTEIGFIPGVMTPSEAMLAHSYGYSLLKLFPAEVSGGCTLLKAMGAPLPELNFCPTGGISVKNLAQYLTLDNVPVVGGTWLAPIDQIQQQNWQHIRDNMQQLQAILADFN